MANFSFRIARPLLHLIDPEAAHSVTLWALRLGLAGSSHERDDPLLSTRVWDLEFKNPLGLAAGFDKDAEVMDAMLALGFGFVEAGTVTPQPQPGNPRPRLFRLAADEAVINRFGFNSKGLAAFVARLQARRQGGGARGIVGANVGKNRDATDAADDYAKGIAAVGGLADYLVCNLSSPNTPGLRNLQGREQMREVVVRAKSARQNATGAGRLPPLLFKVGPDLDRDAIRDIAEVALAEKIDGLIVGNTTLDRPASLKSAQRGET
ncbi:MAG: dihydroorotate dehydrogenase (quinone), partial [Burkholderiales bacterium]